MKTIINFKYIEEFETSRLRARRIYKSDYEVILPTYQNPKVMATLGGLIPENIVKERFLKSIANWDEHGFDAWLWFEKSSNKFVGRAGLRKRELEGEQVVEVGYVLLPEFWNKGIATEMAAASIEVAFEVLKLKELVCFTTISNTASQNVMKKVGFKYDRNFIYSDEEHVLYRFANNMGGT